jgi:hypothetical protein
MRTTITPAEHTRIAELMVDGRQLLAAVAEIERQIALILEAEQPDVTDTISDAIGIPLSSEQLLEQLQITTETT